MYVHAHMYTHIHAHTYMQIHAHTHTPLQTLKVYMFLNVESAIMETSHRLAPVAEQLSILVFPQQRVSGLSCTLEP